MRASEHLALCEAKRGGSTEQSALCEELEVRESSNAGFSVRWTSRYIAA